jgi:ferredoxin-NADP reductase
MTVASIDAGRVMRVAALRPVGDRTVELILAGSGLPRWAPGAHVDLVLPSGQVRPYSLAGDPDDARSWRLLIAYSGGGASAQIHHALRVGDEVRVRGPRNLFPLGMAPRYLFLASGAGIAPLLPMARRVRAARIHPWSMIHIDADGGTGALAAEVGSLGPDCRSSSDPATARDALALAPSRTAVYACGSGRFVDAIADAAPTGVEVHRQRFDAPPTEPGAAHPFELELARRGETVRVEAGTSVLTALHRAGVPVPVACGTGICGACVVGVVGGEVQHRDAVLRAADRAASRLIVTCVSTAAGDRLSLDL